MVSLRWQLRQSAQLARAARPARKIIAVSRIGGDLKVSDRCGCNPKAFQIRRSEWSMANGSPPPPSSATINALPQEDKIAVLIRTLGRVANYN
jgi:hypothetical protein